MYETTSRFAEVNKTIIDGWELSTAAADTTSINPSSESPPTRTQNQNDIPMVGLPWKTGASKMTSSFQRICKENKLGRRLRNSKAER